MPSSFLSEAKSLLVESFRGWREMRAPRWAAAIAYYAVFSLAPFLLLLIFLAGVFFEESTVRSQVARQLAALMGSEGSEFVSAMLSANPSHPANLLAAGLGFLVLLFGVTGLVTQLHDALEEAWGIEAGRSFWIARVKRFFTSYLLVAGTGFLLLVSLFVNVALSTVAEHLCTGECPRLFWFQLVSQIVSFFFTFGLFALIYRLLPEKSLRWRSVLEGSLVSAALFTGGKAVIGLYLGHATVASAFGAAKSLAVVLVWVYYSAQIFLFSAVFIAALARRRGELPKKAGSLQPPQEG